MTEDKLNDFHAALLAYVEGQAGEVERQAIEKRLQSEPALQARILAMIADRARIQDLPRVSMPSAPHWRQSVLELVRREHRHRRVLAQIRYVGMAAAALLLAAAMSLRIIWPASTGLNPVPKALAVNSAKRSPLAQPPPTSTSASNFKLARQSASSRMPMAAARPEGAELIARQSLRKPMAAAATPWTLVIRLKTSAQGHRLNALLAKFARQNRRLRAVARHDAVNQVHAEINSPPSTPSPTPAITKSLQAHRASGSANGTSIPVKPPSPIHAVPAGGWSMTLQPTQVRLLCALFPAVHLIAPTGPGHAQQSAAFGSRQGIGAAKNRGGRFSKISVRQQRAIKKSALLANGVAALHKSVTTQQRSLPRQALAVAAKALALPTQAERFIIKILPPRK